jgi:hypothetical protein
MFVKSLDDLPESLRDQFIEVEGGWQDKDSLELKQHLFNVKDENKTLKATREEFERQQREAAEAKLQQELEAAKKANNLDEVLRIEREKAADAARKAKEEGKLEAVKEFAAERANDKRKAIIAQLSAKGVDDGAREAMADLLERHVVVSAETHEIIFKDSTGGALSVDAAGFVSEMIKMPKFSRLMEAQAPNSGAGAANGSGGAGSPAIKNPFSKESFNLTEQARLLKTNPSEAARLKQLAGN